MRLNNAGNGDSVNRHGRLDHRKGMGMNPRQYWTACRLHDWYYSYSDDPEVYRNGRDEQARLELLARNHAELADIFAQWEEHNFNCGAMPPEPKLEDV